MRQKRIWGAHLGADEASQDMESIPNTSGPNMMQLWSFSGHSHEPSTTGSERHVGGTEGFMDTFLESGVIKKDDGVDRLGRHASVLCVEMMVKKRHSINCRSSLDLRHTRSFETYLGQQ